MTVPPRSPTEGDLPPAQSPADIPKLLRATGGNGFTRDGQPQDGGQWPEQWRHMLDTDVCVYLAEKRSPEFERRLAQCRRGEVVISAITLAELRYGAAVIRDEEERKKRDAVIEVIRRIIPVIPFGEQAALAYAQVRLADPKRNIRAMDKLIAAHAIALNLILVTNNTKDFQKFRPALRVQNWTVAKG